MTAAEFWDGDPYLAAAYHRANQMSIQRKSEEMWLQGMYIYNAVGVVVGNALKKKGSKRLEYLKEPVRLIPLTEEEKEEKAKAERQKVIDYFNNLQRKQEVVNERRAK